MLTPFEIICGHQTTKMLSPNTIITPYNILHVKREKKKMYTDVRVCAIFMYIRMYSPGLRVSHLFPLCFQVLIACL